MISGFLWFVGSNVDVPMSFIGPGFLAVAAVLAPKSLFKVPIYAAAFVFLWVTTSILMSAGSDGDLVATLNISTLKGQFLETGLIVRLAEWTFLVLTGLGVGYLAKAGFEAGRQRRSVAAGIAVLSLFAGLECNSHIAAREAALRAKVGVEQIAFPVLAGAVRQGWVNEKQSVRAGEIRAAIRRMVAAYPKPR